MEIRNFEDLREIFNAICVRRGIGYSGCYGDIQMLERISLIGNDYTVDVKRCDSQWWIVVKLNNYSIATTEKYQTLNVLLDDDDNLVFHLRGLNNPLSCGGIRYIRKAHDDQVIIPLGILMRK